MARAKIPRKSTNVDMTAMCDVAFLLLSFFILVAKYKPVEALNVTTPSYIDQGHIDEKDVVLVTMDKDGRVYFSVSDVNTTEKQAIISAINTAKGLNLTDAEMKHFYSVPTAYIGVPFSQLRPLLDKNPDDLKNVKMPGIPCTDSTNNELIDWVGAAVKAFAGEKMHIMVKGDVAAKYPSFDGVIIAMKKNDQLKFQLITNPIGTPEGSELAKSQPPPKS
jgi:biopolymer transport protein ExbD